VKGAAPPLLLTRPLTLYTVLQTLLWSLRHYSHQQRRWFIGRCHGCMQLQLVQMHSLIE
jgi:hypothetical protein